jgi:hypothetical protein
MTAWARGNAHGKVDRQNLGRWNLGKLSASQTSAMALVPPHAMPEALQEVRLILLGRDGDIPPCGESPGQVYNAV